MNPTAPTEPVHELFLPPKERLKEEEKRNKLVPSTLSLIGILVFPVHYTHIFVFIDYPLLSHVRMTVVYKSTSRMKLPSCLACVNGVVSWMLKCKEETKDIPDHHASSRSGSLACV